MNNVEKILIEEIQKFFKKTGRGKAVIGVSGGIDSSVTLKLAVDALGAKNIIAISMPEIGISRAENTDHAKKLCKFLNVKYHTIPINKYLIPLQLLPWEQNLVSTINIKPRVRMIILYNFANAENAIVLGTSNKSEILLGYGTKHGDLAADIEVLGDLLKTEVKKLAQHQGLPDEIIEKAPSAELYKEQTDENELGFTYEKIDQVLIKYLDGVDALIDKGMSPQLVHFVFQRIKQNKHKSEMPKIIKIK